MWRQAFNERHSAFEGFAAKRQAPFATAALERICGLYDAMASAAQAPHRFALDLSKFAPVFQALSNAHIDISLPFDPKADPDVGRKIGNMLQKACDGIGNARAFIDPLVEGMDEWLPALPVLSGQQPKKRADPDVWRLYIPTPWNTVLSPDFSASVQLAANNIMPRMLSALGYPKLALDASWWGGRTDTGDRFRTTISAQWVKSKQSQEPSMAMTNVSPRYCASDIALARCFQLKRGKVDHPLSGLAVSGHLPG